MIDYNVKLEMFEGPLDLLLHLIHKNEVDIFDIPIAAITDQYLEYLELMQSLEMGIAGDFLVMASTLIHIKSRMLLPGRHEGDEEDDPRLEITRPLLEYMQLKEMAKELSERKILGRDVFTRGDATSFDEYSDLLPTPEVTLFQLMDAFRRVVASDERPGNLKVSLEKWSVKDKIEHLIALLREKPDIFFEDIFTTERDISELVVTFLALLELVHMGLIKVYQPSEQSRIRLTACFDESDSVVYGMNDGK
ncbi:MAG: segregation/condensation protein A [Deltaproteobacteria bacterium]|nr:segregation/condensation protein A [Deltaproteobacteria bacterium]